MFGEKPDGSRTRQRRTRYDSRNGGGEHSPSRHDVPVIGLERLFLEAEFLENMTEVQRDYQKGGRVQQRAPNPGGGSPTGVNRLRPHSLGVAMA